MKRLTTFNLETIVIQVTTRCPYNCPQCYMQRGNEDISIDVAKRAVDEAARNGAQAVQLTGGEPALYDGLLELIKHASENGLMTAVATSGYGASYEYYKKLRQAGLTALCVSVNGMTEKTSLLSRESFEKSLYAVQAALQAQLVCFVNTVVTDDNSAELNVLGQYLMEKGVEGMNILRPVSSYDQKYVPSVSSDTLNRIKTAVNNKPGFYRVENCYKEYWRYIGKGELSCQDIGNKTYFINVDGSVSPCSKLLQYKYTTFHDMLNRAQDWKTGCS